MSAWKRLSEIVRIDSDWVRVIGERWLCDQGRELEYWRVEKVDSVIVLPVQAGCLLCVRPRLPPRHSARNARFPRRPPARRQAPRGHGALAAGARLGVPNTAIHQVSALNQQPWMINSAFSNQGLWGVVATLDPAYPIPPQHIGQTAPATDEGVQALLDALNCLQCRAVLLEWQRQGARA